MFGRKKKKQEEPKSYLRCPYCGHAPIMLNEGWQILRVDTMPPTELRNNAVAATNVYILEREANDD